MRKLLISCVVVSVSISSLYSQNKTITGKVISEDLRAMAFTLILINDSIEVAKTDVNGFFQVNIPKSSRKVFFRQVGFEQAVTTIIDTCNEVEVVMMFNVHYDFVPLKKVDRLRMKRFKKLPEIHKQAFAKGLFKRNKGCYTQEFISYNKKSQK